MVKLSELKEEIRDAMTSCIEPDYTYMNIEVMKVFQKYVYIQEEGTELEVGDIVQAVDCCPNPHMCIWEIVEDGVNLKLYPYEVAHKSIVQTLINEGVSRIIQRNGKPVITVEKENK